jgi:hypothetical protein
MDLDGYRDINAFQSKKSNFNFLFNGALGLPIQTKTYVVLARSCDRVKDTRISVYSMPKPKS